MGGTGNDSERMRMRTGMNVGICGILMAVLDLDVCIYSLL